MEVSSNSTTGTDADLLGPKPKRPLSSYNFFFQSERQKLLRLLPTRAQGKPARSHGKCGFADMAKFVAKKWNENDVDPQERIVFEEMARKEKARYMGEMSRYKQRRNELRKQGLLVDKAASSKKSSKPKKRSAPPTQEKEGAALPLAPQTTDKAVISPPPTSAATTTTTTTTTTMGVEIEESDDTSRSTDEHSSSLSVAENEAIASAPTTSAYTTTATTTRMVLEPQDAAAIGAVIAAGSGAFLMPNMEALFMNQQQQQLQALPDFHLQPPQQQQESSSLSHFFQPFSQQQSQPEPQQGSSQSHPLSQNIDRLAQELDEECADFLIGLFHE